MKKFVALLSLSIVLPLAANAARPTLSAPKAQVAVPHDHAPKIHTNAPVAHR